MLLRTEHYIIAYNSILSPTGVFGFDDQIYCTFIVTSSEITI
jgi:hypothetical protein